MTESGWCPTCSTLVDFTERCPSRWGVGQCVENTGHDGWHWSDVGRGDGSVLRWTGVYSVRTCPERLNLMVWCQKPPGHDGGHNDGHGMTWIEDET